MANLQIISIFYLLFFIANAHECIHGINNIIKIDYIPKSLFFKKKNNKKKFYTKKI